MSELIRSEEAKLMWAMGESVQYYVTTSKNVDWKDICNSSHLSIFDNAYIKFRLKPKTITINGVDLAQWHSIQLNRVTSEIKIRYENLDDADKAYKILKDQLGGE